MRTRGHDRLGPLHPSRWLPGGYLFLRSVVAVDAVPYSGCVDRAVSDLKWKRLRPLERRSRFQAVGWRNAQALAHFRQHLLPLLQIRWTHPELRVHREIAAVVDDRQGFFANAAQAIARLANSSATISQKIACSSSSGLFANLIRPRRRMHPAIPDRNERHTRRVGRCSCAVDGSARALGPGRRKREPGRRYDRPGHRNFRTHSSNPMAGPFCSHATWASDSGYLSVPFCMTTY